jgi:Ger(x)C family germination protein
MKVRIAFVLLTCLLLTGCWDQLVLDDLAFVFGMAIDIAPDREGFYLAITSLAFAEDAQRETVKTIVYTRSISQGIMNLQRQRERIVSMGKVRVIIFSTETAKSKVFLDVVNQLDQQRDMNPNAWVVISEEIDAREALYLRPPAEQKVAVYLDNLLTTGRNTGQIPKLTLSHFWAHRHTWGVNPIVPMVKKTENDSLMLSGLALIDGEGKMVGQLSDQEAITFLIITRDITRSRIFTEVDYAEQKNRWISMFVKGVDRKTHTKIENDKAVIDLNFRLKFDVINLDMDLEDVLDEKIFSGLETSLARDLQGNIQKVINTAQELKSDPFGLGQHVRAQNLQWSRNKDWGEEFSQSRINVQVEVEIHRIGTLLNPRF